MLYKIIKPPKQKEIIKELNDNFSLYFDPVEKFETRFYGGNVPLIKKLCPTLSDFLQQVNLYDRWRGAGISVISSDQVPHIHIDSNDPARQYALNIPIFNCQDSYTVWYEPIDPGLATAKEYTSNGVKVVYRQFTPDNAVEIGRICSDAISFVSIKTPHRGLNNNNELRALVSLRFVPELTLEEIEKFEVDR